MGQRKFITAILIFIAMGLMASSTVQVDNIKNTKTDKMVKVEIMEPYYDYQITNVHKFERVIDNGIFKEMMSYKAFYYKSTANDRDVCFMYFCIDSNLYPKLAIWSSDGVFLFRDDLMLNLSDDHVFKTFSFTENGIYFEIRISDVERYVKSDDEIHDMIYGGGK
jgi:hypothetical protein